MPVRFKKVIDSPVNNSIFTQLIKECCVVLPDVKEYVGKCIAEFGKLAMEKKIYKNFKFTVKSESGQKLFCLIVEGDLIDLTYAKFYINHRGIYKYDWRFKNWKVIKIISVVAVRAEVVGIKVLIDINGVSTMLECNTFEGISGVSNFVNSNNQIFEEYNESFYNEESKIEYDEDSDSQNENQENIEDSTFDLDQSYQIDKNNEFEYIQCKYWNDVRFCFIKFGCCDDWCCCRYCHMDSLDHRIGNEINNQVYCLRCSTVFQIAAGKCPKCCFEHLYKLNFRSIADRCRFLMNASFIPKKDCCNNFICCYRCHNEEYDHMAGNNISYFCCHCSNETNIDTDYCNNCGNYIKTDVFNLEKIALKCFYLTRYYYLISFECCGNTYCCSKCHDGCEDHKAIYSNDKVCIKCGTINKTKLESFYCTECNQALYSAINR